MKRVFFLFLFSICFVSNAFTQENNIWGVWNTEDRNHPSIKEFTNKDGSFMETVNSYTFISNIYPRSAIAGRGDAFYIIEIIENKMDTVSLYIETILLDRDDHPLVNAKIVMHFIDQDHMWMEVDTGDEQYSTDLRFLDYDFNGFDEGPSVIFWRERVVMNRNTTADDKHYEGTVIEENITDGDKIGVDERGTSNTDSEAILINNRKNLTWLFSLLLIPLVIFGVFMLKRKQG
jgi:hypothetical protein